MKTISYLGIGILFGITMFKSEAASWFRIYEMFRFDSFHMFGIIGSALAFGILLIQWVKRKDIKASNGNTIIIEPKEKGIKRYLFGGIIFGLGWALAGACPGPMFTLLGGGYFGILIVILGSLLGTFLYGVFRNKLPH